MKHPFPKSKPTMPAKQDFRQAQVEYQETVVGLCLVCTKPVKGGYYGQWQGGGVCNKTCNTVQATKPLYPDNTESQFLNRFNLE